VLNNYTRNGSKIRRKATIHYLLTKILDLQMLVMMMEVEWPCTRLERFQERDIKIQIKLNGRSLVTSAREHKLNLLTMALLQKTASKEHLVTAGLSVPCLC